MEYQETERFLLGTLHPMGGYTFPYICQVFGTDDRRSGQLVGSGFRCVLRGRRVIVTAAHVIKEGLANFADLGVSTGDERRPHLVNGAIIGDDLSDIAIYPLPDNVSVSASSRFWPEDRIDRVLDRLSSDYLFLHGFPRLRHAAAMSREEYRTMSHSLPYGVMQRIDDLPTDLAPFEFAMDFSPPHIQAEGNRPPEAQVFERDPSRGPRGLSGSPVWRIGVSGRRASEWNPDWCELVGIVTQWRPAHKLLVASKSTKLLELADAT